MPTTPWDELPATLNNGSATSTAADGNIALGKDNLAINGPCFASPSTTKGYAGYSLSDQWNPRAISVLTDAGFGKKDKDNDNETGAYQKWWEAHLTRLGKYGYPAEYVRYADATDNYLRYVGPIDENGVVSSKPIDIGMYEFQYVFKLSDRDQLYIGTEQKGKGDGSDWDNQSTDLRGAIIAMANATGKETTSSHAHKKVYVRGGTYYSPTYCSTSLPTVSL